MGIAGNFKKQSEFPVLMRWSKSLSQYESLSNSERGRINNIKYLLPLTDKLLCAKQALHIYLHL